MTNDKLYLQTMVKQHADANGAIVQLQKENAALREAAKTAQRFLRVHYTMSNEDANRISYEIDKQREILNILDTALEKAV